MIVSDMNGSKYTGTAEEIVTQLRQACVSKPQANIDYMKEFSQRARFFKPEAVIRDSTERVFLHDAIAAGFLRRVDGKE